MLEHEHEVKRMYMAPDPDRPAAVKSENAKIADDLRELAAVLRDRVIAFGPEYVDALLHKAVASLADAVAKMADES